MRLHPRDDLSSRRQREQTPALEMVRYPNGREHRDNRRKADVTSPTSPLQRVRVNKLVAGRAPETQNVAVLEPAFAAYPLSVDQRALIGLEVDDIVTAARVSDERMTNIDARIADAQCRSFVSSDVGFTPPEQQQPRAIRISTDREQTCSLRSPR